jgi:transposase
MTSTQPTAQPIRQAYASDLTDYEWPLLEGPVQQSSGPGRKRTVDIREILNAILYLNRTGCQWRMLPHRMTCPTGSLSPTTFIPGSLTGPSNASMSGCVFRSAPHWGVSVIRAVP